MNYDEIFDSSVPRAMQRDSVRIIWHGYQETFREVNSRHARPEAHDLLGHERRAYIERELRAMAELYPDTVAMPEWNKTKTAAHTIITRGVIKLTESKVRTPWTIVHPSVFRSEYAEVFQPDLFQPDEYEERDEISYIYSIILHGCEPSTPSIPSFIHVVFPDRDFQTYIHRINLFKKFPDLLDELQGRPTDQTPPPPPLFLRKNRRAEEEDE
jgi:hypothetical protein